MPASVIAAVASSYIGTAVATGLAYAATGFVATVGFSLVEAAASFAVSSMLKSALGGGGETSQLQPVSQQRTQRMQIIRSPAASRQIVYGRVMTSGALVYATTKDDGSNEYVWLVIAFAGHECQSCGTFYLNDVAVGALDGNGEPTTGQFVGFAKFNVHLGATDQTADTDLMAYDTKWTANHRLRGIAYVAVRLKYDQTVFPTGIPNVRFVVEGKNTIYDPRTATSGFTKNSALIARDYLTTHFGATSGELDDATFIAAANICDEDVTITQSYSSRLGGARGSVIVEDRYTCNGVIGYELAKRNAMETILTSCGGNLTTPEGKYVLHVAAYTTPVMTLDETYLRAPIKIRTAVSRKELFNAVRGQYVSESAYWQAADFVPITNSTYATDDGGQIFTDIQLPMTVSGLTAQRIARIMLEKSRQGITVDMPCNIMPIGLQPQDNVYLTIDHLGWASKVFKVMQIKLNDSGAVDLIMQEESSTCYATSTEETTVDPAPDTTLPNPFTCQMPGNVQMVETIYETTGSAGVRSKATLTWDAPVDAFIIDYEVEYKLASSGTWLEIFNVRGETYEFYDLTPEKYDFRVKARNILGVVSDYTPAKTFVVYGLTVAPGDVANFVIRPMAGMALAMWDKTTDLDVKIGGDVIIRWSPLTTGATWADGVILPDGTMNGDATSAIVPLATGTYMMKFKDSTGHYSDNAASFVATEALVSGWTTIATSTQHSAFAGVKDGVAYSASAGALELDGTTLVDDWGAIDGLGYVDSIGGVRSSGTYYFDNTVDMSTVGTRRFHAHIKAQAYVSGDMIDDWLEHIDDRQDIDGGVVNDTSAMVFASLSDDNITYGAWTSFMVADFNTRYAKFKCVLTSNDSTHNIHVYELSVTTKELT